MTTTRNAFLGGRVQVIQPRVGYRAGTDPVLMAAACPARDGDRVLDLGCGVGTAGLCLAARVPVSVVGLEAQAAYAALARENGIEVIEGDVAQMPDALRAQSFDHVMCNPPYFPAGGGSASHDGGREMALREEVPLAVWLDAGVRRLRPTGTMTMILRTDRLVDLMAALDKRLGAVKVLPLASRALKPAGRFLFQAQKGARAAPQLLPPFVLHRGAQHVEDGDDFSDAATAVLRGGAEISL